MWLSQNKFVTQPKIVERTSSTLPQATQTPYFTISGKILITNINQLKMILF